MKVSNLNKEEILAGLSDSGMNVWQAEENYLFRKLVFKDFREALKAMNEIGEKAEEFNHHPDWRNVYNILEIKLSTHETAGITSKDFELAKAINDIFNKYR